MRLLLSVFFSLLAGTGVAQDTATAAGRTSYRQEIQLYTGYQRTGSSNTLVHAGVWYCLPEQKKGRFKVGVAYSHYEDFGSPSFRPAGPDSIRITSRYEKLHFVSAALGWERIHPVKPQLDLYAGAEARLGYGRGRIQNTLAVEPAPVSAALGLYNFQPVTDEEPVNALLTQARGCIGLRSSFGRLAAGADVGAFFNGLCQSYGNTGIFDVTLGADYRLFVGFRF